MEYEINTLPFICEALCCTQKAYKHIDKIYNTNKQEYDKAAKESEYYEFASEKNIVEESYFKKVLGILNFDNDDENIMYILKMTYKKASQMVKNNNIISVEKFANKLNLNKLSTGEINGNFLALLLIAKYENKQVDETEGIYNDFGTTLVLRDKYTNRNKELRYENFDKNKRKRLREIQLNLQNKYPCLQKYTMEYTLIDPETGRIKFNEMTDYQRIVYSLDFIYDIEGIDACSLIEDKPFTDKEMQELINLWGIPNGSLDHVYYDKLYAFMYPAVHIRHLLKAYKRAKKYHFDNLDEDTLERLEKVSSELREVHQKNIQLQDENTKLKQRLENEISALKEENRILENKNYQLEKQISEYPNITEELSQLRNLMFELNEDIIEEKVDIDIDEINNLDVICFGGNENWTSSMKEILPNWKFISAGVNFDTTLLKDKEYIFINTVANSHKMYYKIIENKDTNTKLRYINSLNKDRVLYEIKHNL